MGAVPPLASWRQRRARPARCPGEAFTGEGGAGWCWNLELRHQPPCLCSAKVYTADLESALHYLLRVELATRHHLEGEELSIFKDFVTVVAKVTMVHVCPGSEEQTQNLSLSHPHPHPHPPPAQLYPGRGCVLRLMEALSDWLLSLQVQRVSYQKVLDLVDNKLRVGQTRPMALSP